MNRSGIFLGLILIVLFSNKSSSENLLHSGLLFTAAPNPKEQRTSLDLTYDSSVLIRDKFSIGFDFAIWSRDQFGYIFRIFDNTHHTIDLVYMPESGDHPVLRLVVNGLPTTISVPLTETDLVRNNWLHLSFSFDLAKGKVNCNLGNQIFSDEHVSLEGFSQLNICFGANRSIYFPTTDVPRTAIRDIQIRDYNNKLIHNWLLNESEGNQATDIVGNLTAKITNPKWLLNSHFFWTKINELKMEASSGFAFDTTQNRILFIGKHKILSYNIINSEIEERKIKNPKPLSLNPESYYYSFPAKKIYSITTVPNQIRIFEENNNEWEKSANSSEPPESVNSTFFLNEQAGDAYALGGYHKYKYTDFLMRYRFREKRWSHMTLRGDKLIPRSYAAISNTNNPGEYLIFGGYGNVSGLQELGPQCLYDLYRLNINDSVLQKKWDVEHVTENFIPMGSTIVPWQPSALYVLGFSPFLNRAFLKLYRISLEKPEYLAVSDTMHFYFDEERSRASLSYFNKTREFFAVVKTPSGGDSLNYKIFSLNYPPVNRSALSTTIKSVLADPGNWIPKVFWILAGFSLILSYLFFLMLREVYMAKESLEDEEQSNSLVSDKIPVRIENQEKRLMELPRKNAIYLFGEFRIYDTEGVEISHLFSRKLRQLFLSILLLGSDEKGITNEKLNNIHWTFHTSESAKNNRNVNVKKLRDLFANFKGVQILHTDGRWALKLSDEVFCDFNFLLRKMRSIFQLLTREEFEKIVMILAQGSFTTDDRMPWLDSFNSHFLTSLLDYLFLITDSIEKDKNPEAIYQITDLILKSDPLNEEAFKLKIEALISMKNLNQAFFDYTYFTKGYEKMYGIQFPLSFKSFILREEYIVEN